MPGYISGHVEREFGDGWEFVSKIDPFTGSSGNFKYLVFGTGYFEYLQPFPHKEGFPKNLTSATMADIMPWRSGLEINGSLRSEFEKYVAKSGLGDLSKQRYTSMEELSNLDWDSGMSDENFEEFKSDLDNFSRDALRDRMRCFKLVNQKGETYIDEGEGNWAYKLDISDEEIRSLVRNGNIEIEKQVFNLRRKSRRELIPESWFEFINLIQKTTDEWKDVRFIFHWHH